MNLLRFVLFCAIWLAVHVPSAFSESPATTSDADIPIAPLQPVSFQGWTNAIRLANTNLEVVIIPDIGRIAVIRYRESENLLRFAGAPAQTEAAEWINAGGEWLWPVPQSRWPAIWGSDWPPPPELTDRPWYATSWKAADQSLNCSLTREYGRPLSIKVIRNFRLHPEEPEITIRQRIERKQKTALPFALWNVFQVANAEAVFIPTDRDSQFESGFTSMMFEPPQKENLTTCGDVVVYRAGMGEHKLCSDSKRSWIAVLKKGVILFVHVFNDDTDLPYPDGGCRLEMYSNSGLGYTEIETLSPGKTLQGPSALQNTLTVRCFPASAADLCQIAESLLRNDGKLLSEEDIIPATPTGPIPSAPHATEWEESSPSGDTAAAADTSSSIAKSPAEDLSSPSVPVPAPSQE